MPMSSTATAGWSPIPTSASCCATPISQTCRRWPLHWPRPPPFPPPRAGEGQGGGRRIARAAWAARAMAAKPVWTAHAAIAPLGWTVFVELPLSEALAPLYGSALRSAGLLALALGLATLAALFLARRVTLPIRKVQGGAPRVRARGPDPQILTHTGEP